MEKSLSSMKVGERGIIKNISPDYISHLVGIGIRKGKNIEILAIQPMRGPIVIKSGEIKVSLSRNIARYITVEVTEK